MLLSLRIWLGRVLFGVVGAASHPVGIRVSRKRFIKWRCEKPELEALRFVAANTTIPVPRVYKTYERHGKLAIEMEYLRGCKNLREVWQELSDQQKDSISSQLAGYIEQLRALQPPDPSRVSATGGGQCRDIRIGTSKLFGPFDNPASFHRFIRGGMSSETSGAVFGDKVVQVHERQYSIRFTHGDLAALNILVRNGRIAAIIDWECAGWYPEYWEFTKSHYNSVLLPEFHNMLDRKIRPYDDELQAERMLWCTYDQFLDEVFPQDRHVVASPLTPPSLLQSERSP